VGDPHCYGRHGGLSGHPLAPGGGRGASLAPAGAPENFFASWRLVRLSENQKKIFGDTSADLLYGKKFLTFAVN
jgi:hypothetical protein